MILTEDRLREAAKLYKGMRLDESAYQFSEQTQYDLFISHSFKDKELVKGLYSLFEEAGYKVYVDWIEDPNLDRNSVNEKTAKIIKNRMMSCKALAYVSTVNTPSSKWCPWELGFGDGKLGKVCVLPVMKGTYKGQEYLGLYPYLEYSKTTSGKMGFFLYDQNDKKKYIWLKGWLNGEQPTDNHN